MANEDISIEEQIAAIQTVIDYDYPGLTTPNPLQAAITTLQHYAALQATANRIKKPKVKTIRETMCEGSAAYEAGVSKDMNPEQSTRRRNAWWIGWQCAEGTYPILPAELRPTYMIDGD